MGTFCMIENSIVKDGSILATVKELENVEYHDQFNEIATGVFEMTRTIFIGKEVEDYQNLQIGLEINDPIDFYMIPGVNYNGNFWGEGKEPKGLSLGEEPWKFAYHRSGIPAGMYAQNNKFSVGMWGGMESDLHFSCFMTENDENKLSMNLQFPEQEGPVIYCARDQYEEKGYLETYLFDVDRIELKAFIVVCDREKEYDYAMFLSKAWEYYKEEAEPALSKKEVWDLGLHFIINSAYFKDENFNGFCMGLTWNGSQWVQRRDFLEIGWVGQNASLAVSMIYEYAIHGDVSVLQMGLDILDCWIERALLPNGLFRCRFDRILKFEDDLNNKEERNDAANLYSVVDEYLDAYRLLKEIGIERENYKEAALNICNFMVGIQRDNGKFGKAWNNDGTCSDSEGTIGCYIGKALCIAYAVTGKEDYLTSAKKSFGFYYGEFIANGYTTAGALDTYCIDKESAAPLLAMALQLYQFTNEEHYLEAAIMISNYLATWLYHYNVDFPKTTILGQMNYKTRGGTAVSVQHQHIDCYGLVFYEDWILLSRLTGDGIWKERAEAMWCNSLYNISDGQLVIKGQRRPRGSQDEGFLQTRWHTKKGDYFGVSEWLVTWNTAFRLKILRKEYLTRNREYSKADKKI